MNKDLKEIIWLLLGNYWRIKIDQDIWLRVLELVYWLNLDLFLLDWETYQAIRLKVLELLFFNLDHDNPLTFIITKYYIKNHPIESNIIGDFLFLVKISHLVLNNYSPNILVSINWLRQTSSNLFEKAWTDMIVQYFVNPSLDQTTHRPSPP